MWLALIVSRSYQRRSAADATSIGIANVQPGTQAVDAFPWAIQEVGITIASRLHLQMLAKAQIDEDCRSMRCPTVLCTGSVPSRRFLGWLQGIPAQQVLAACPEIQNAALDACISISSLETWWVQSLAHPRPLGQFMNALPVPSNFLVEHAVLVPRQHLRFRWHFCFPSFN